MAEPLPLCYLNGNYLPLAAVPPGGLWTRAVDSVVLWFH